MNTFVRQIAAAMITLLFAAAPAFPLGLEKRGGILPTGTESDLRNPASFWYDKIRNFLVVANTHGRNVLVLSRQGQLIKAIGADDGVTFPTAVAAKRNGTLYVAEKGSEGIKVFQRYDSQVREEHQLIDLGPYRRSTSIQPVALHLDEAGKLYVLDRGNRQVLVFDVNEKFQFAIPNVGDPADLWVDPSGAIMVADPGLGGIRVFTPKGKWQRTIGGYSSQFREPLRVKGLTLDRRGRIWVVEESNQKIRALDAFGNLLVTIESGVVMPADIVADDQDNLYVLEQGGNRIAVFHISEF